MRFCVSLSWSVVIKTKIFRFAKIVYFNAKTQYFNFKIRMCLRRKNCLWQIDIYEIEIFKNSFTFLSCNVECSAQRKYILQGF